MLEVELVSCSTGQSITHCNVKKLYMSHDSKYWVVQLHNRTKFYEFEWYQLKRCENIGTEPEPTLSAEEITDNFLGSNTQGTDAYDDFMTALKDVMGEEE